MGRAPQRRGWGRGDEAVEGEGTPLPLEVRYIRYCCYVAGQNGASCSGLVGCSGWVRYSASVRVADAAPVAEP
jgi:hypothetical protein